jgi:hypothetical protein
MYLSVKLVILNPNESLKNFHKYMLKITLTVKEKAVAEIHPLSYSGKDRKVEKTSWKVVSGDSTIIPAEDGLSAEIVSSDTPGVTLILVGGDSDLNPNKDQFIFNEIEVHVVEKREDKSQGKATNLGIKVGKPSKK